MFRWTDDLHSNPSLLLGLLASGTDAGDAGLGMPGIDCEAHAVIHLLACWPPFCMPQVP